MSLPLSLLALRPQANRLGGQQPGADVHAPIPFSNLKQHALALVF